MFDALILLLALATGCAGLKLPKTITQGDVTPQRKKRNEEITKQFDKQRDFAEYEAAKVRWEQQRDQKGCREALEKLLARRPQHREARLLMAELLLAEDDPQAACEQAKKALDAYPNDAQVQYTMALTLDAQGKAEDALAYYERASKMDPRSEDLAAAYRTAREVAREESRHSKAADGTGKRLPSHFGRGAGGESGVENGHVENDSMATDAFTLSLSQRERGPTQSVSEGVAVGYVEAAAPLPPPTGQTGSRGVASPTDSAGVAVDGPADALLRKGQTALADGSPQTALEHLRQAVATKPDNPQILISAAAVALRANRPELAVELLTPGIKRFPNSAAVHRMLGVAYYRTGDYKSSQVALQQALSLDKSSALSYLLMGCTLAKLGQNETAEAHFRQARTLDPKYKFVR
jgi:tetratricopeptide (TPR) repeat protein